MTSVLEQNGIGARQAAVISICPNTVLSALILTSLVFVSYLGRISVLVFLAAGLLLLLRRADLAMDETRRHWWLYLLPVWCILSLLWSEHPDLSLRHGVQLLLTFLISVTIASRLSPLVFLRVLFLSLMIAGLASLLIGNVREDGIWIGIFESKNYYAFTMVSLVLCSFALLADRGQARTWRRAGLLGLLVGLPQIVMAESVGAVLATAFVFGAALVILGTQLLPPARRMAAIALFCVFAVIVVLVSIYFLDAIIALVIDVTGKDPSLTGRTDLWASAMDQISRSPLLGTGYRAFWVEGNALAEQIWADFYIASKSGFNFHNLFLSNAVDIGIVGVVLLLTLLIPALLLSTRWVLYTGRASALFCFMATAFVMVLSMVEVPVFFEFNALTVMVVASLAYALRANREVDLLHPESAARMV
ncbi:MULTISPECIES: O-antigen ligase family protein [Tabrizicola]|uniref:O-antigen ligase family protein n=1 Tax=Tabrizicola TaxID=1443919 RepID=UPI00108146DF|nr:MULTISPECIES: O-antigen ligase family protein [Paracoccaceae]